MRVESEADYDKQDEVLSLSGPDFYLYVRISPDELASLTGIESASWDNRTSIRAGETLSHPVHWSRNSVRPTMVDVLVGPDDETWGLALEFPANVLARLLEAS